MRKLIIALLFLAPYLVMAQSATLVTVGVSHNIADAYTSAADSIHTIGTFDMRDGAHFADSVQIICETQDSLNIRYFIVPTGKYDAAGIADSVAGVGFTTNVASGGYQFTAAGFGCVPWHNIVAAIKPKHQYDRFTIYARVYAVGSEVASSGKQFQTLVKRYY